MAEDLKLRPSQIESIEEAMSTPYEINWYVYGTPQDDIKLIESKIDEYIKDKINATVECCGICKGKGAGHRAECGRNEEFYQI